MRWFRVHVELIDDPKFIKLGHELRSALLMTWCVAAANDGRLPPIEDIAIKFRMPEARTEKLIDDLRRHGFIDDDEAGSAPHNWAGRQFRSDTDATAPSRSKRYRDRKRDAHASVTRDGHHDGTVAVTPPRTDHTRTYSELGGVTGHALIEIVDEQALRAWDAYGRANTGKAFPRNKRGGWRFPSRWPPGHEAQVRPIGRAQS
jgi:hypothetical protein